MVKVALAGGSSDKASPPSLELGGRDRAGTSDALHGVPMHRGIAQSIDVGHHVHEAAIAGKRAWGILKSKLSNLGDSQLPLASADHAAKLRRQNTQSEWDEAYDDPDEERLRALERVQYGLDDTEGPMSSDLVNVPSARCADKQRRKLVRTLDGAAVQTTVLLLIVVDISLTIYQIAADAVEPSREEPVWMFVLTFTIVTALVLEVSLRLLGLGVSPFFKKWCALRRGREHTLHGAKHTFHGRRRLASSRMPRLEPNASPLASACRYNTLDLAVSVASLALELVVLITFLSAHAGGGGDATSASNLSALRVLRPAARVLRCLRFSTRKQHMQSAARLIVGGNKRRFVQVREPCASPRASRARHAAPASPRSRPKLAACLTASSPRSRPISPRPRRTASTSTCATCTTTSSACRCPPWAAP